MPRSLQVEILLQSVELWAVVELGVPVAIATPTTGSEDAVTIWGQAPGGPDKGDHTGCTGRQGRYDYYGDVLSALYTAYAASGHRKGAVGHAEEATRAYRCSMDEH
jgi:hypothetical protein